MNVFGVRYERLRYLIQALTSYGVLGPWNRCNFVYFLGVRTFWCAFRSIVDAAAPRAVFIFPAISP